MNNSAYLLALHSIDGLGPIRLKAILNYFQDPKLAWQANSQDLFNLGIPNNTIQLLLDTRKKLEPEKYAQSIKDDGIKWLTLFDESYPELLAQIYDPPTVLFYKGEILPSDEKAIAIVGTRKITGYGKTVTEKFTSYLVSAGLTIVSGLAKGIDSAAHWTAINEKGRTIAVLGGGINNIFPPENKVLAEKVINGFGAVISELPPDAPSLPGNFPSRNRIISGLSLATLVVEAAEGSGSLITAKLALEQGREVFAIPGPVTSYLSKGPIDLIKMGARAVFEPAEILEEMGIKGRQQAAGYRQQEIQKLSDDEKKILEVLENETRHLDEIGRILKFPSPKVSALLLKMEISGLVQSLGSGNYTKS